MKLLTKTTENDGRLDLIRDFLSTDWTIEVVDAGNRTELAARLREADAMISMNWPGDMPPAPKLRLLQLPGAGTDDVVFSSVPAQASVCNVFGHETAIAEYVMAAMLQWSIGIPGMDTALRKNEWRGSHLVGPRHRELCGQTLGIVGHGRIGREVARRAAAFGMSVLACSRTPHIPAEFVKQVEPMQSLPDLLGESDFVVLALPLNSNTAGLIGEAQLGQMKPTAVIINVARGALIDEQALFSACRKRSIGGAIIDTWYRYPSPDVAKTEPSMYPFRELDNVIMTPHASGWTEELKPRRCRSIACNLDRLARGDTLLNVVKAPS